MTVSQIDSLVLFCRDEVDFRGDSLIPSIMKLLSMENAYIHIDDAWLREKSQYITQFSLGECARDIVSTLIYNAKFRGDGVEDGWNRQNPMKYRLEAGQAPRYYEILGKWPRHDIDYIRAQDEVMLFVQPM